MKRVFLASAWIALSVPAAAEPVDLTGTACSRPSNFGLQMWEFFGDVAIQYHADGSVSRFSRIGPGAYEKFEDKGTDKGEWRAVYYFFRSGGELQIRILSVPGLLVKSENPNAPLEKGIVPFNGTCVLLEESR